MSGSDPENSRWEWRVFWPEGVTPPPEFTDLTRFENEAPDEFTGEKCADTYIIIPGSTANLKLEGCSAVSCKALVPTTESMTLYREKERSSFPLDAETFKAWTGITVRTDVATHREFIDTILRHCPGTKIVVVEKERKIAEYDENEKCEEKLEGMKAEFASLKICGKTFQTFCLECESKEKLDAVVKKMKVGGGCVMDYTKFLIHAGAPTPSAPAKKPKTGLTL